MIEFCVCVQTQVISLKVLQLCNAFNYVYGRVTIFHETTPLKTTQNQYICIILKISPCY